jgi:hypothetical protein
MKKTLFKLSFGYSTACSDADMKILIKYYPKFCFKEQSDFGVASYYKEDEKYQGWLDEDFNILQADEYDEYIQQESRSFHAIHDIEDGNYIDLEAFLKEDLNIKFEIVGRKTITFTQPDHDFGVAEYVGLFKTLEKLSHQLDNKQTFSSHCDVHIGGNPLWQVNDLMLCEDFCTDNLQQRLNEGWRILACCMQSQRRPDYVLGRYTPDFNSSNDRAERG